MNLNLLHLIDDEKCYDAIRQKRWPNGVTCPHCNDSSITKQGRDTTQPARRKYRCSSCLRYFDDLTGTILAGRHQTLQVWVLCMYFMGLNLSNEQIAKELCLNPSDTHNMTRQIREGLIARVNEPVLSGTVECDEVYIVAGHKGNPAAVRKKNAEEDAED